MDGVRGAERSLARQATHASEARRLAYREHKKIASWDAILIAQERREAKISA